MPMGSGSTAIFSAIFSVLAYLQTGTIWLCALGINSPARLVGQTACVPAGGWRAVPS